MAHNISHCSIKENVYKTPPQVLYSSYTSWEYARFKISTEKIQVMVLWVLTSCNYVTGYQHFGGSCHHLHHEERCNMVLDVKTQTTTRVESMPFKRMKNIFDVCSFIMAFFHIHNLDVQ
jgi:hypothetical protein